MTKLFHHPITINEITYRLNYCDVIVKDGLECRGLLKPNEAVIELEDGLSDAVLKQTLLHEVMHGIQLAYVLELDERDIDCLASGVLSLIKHNPELIKYLAKKESK